MKSSFPYEHEILLTIMENVEVHFRLDKWLPITNSHLGSQCKTEDVPKAKPHPSQEHKTLQIVSVLPVNSCTACFSPRQLVSMNLSMCSH